MKKNFAVIDSALANLGEVAVPKTATSKREAFKTVPDTAPEFVRKVTAIMLEGRGDSLPVSAVTGTHEKVLLHSERHQYPPTLWTEGHA